MTTFVLVPGAWLGGWCWKQVVPLLRGEGHEVYTLTLTGLGERAHLARPEVDLETHITDVVNVFEYEDLCNVVLLGHSYAGVVVTGVAERIPNRLSQLVYLDTGPLLDGVALIDTYPTEARTHVERQVEELGDGWRLPMPPWDELAEQASLAGLDNQQRMLMHSRSVAQPFGTYTQPLQLKNPAREAVRRTPVRNSQTHS